MCHRQASRKLLYTTDDETKLKSRKGHHAEQRVNGAGLLESDAELFSTVPCLFQYHEAVWSP